MVLNGVVLAYIIFAQSVHLCFNTTWSQGIFVTFLSLIGICEMYQDRNENEINEEKLRLDHDGAIYGRLGSNRTWNQNHGYNCPVCPGLRDMLNNGLTELTPGPDYDNCQTHLTSNGNSIFYKLEAFLQTPQSLSCLMGKKGNNNYSL